MLTFPIKNLFVEGSDCSGKSTLIKKIHANTNYSWHIHDRSQVSRTIFAEMYERGCPSAAFDLHEEMSNLNNRWIFLNPPLETVLRRFSERGDEIHDVGSLRKVWLAFRDFSTRVKDHPNFLIFDDSDTGNIADKSAAALHLSQRPLLREISDQVFKFVGNTESFESYPLTFTLYDDGAFEEANSNSMDYEPEREYYEKIYSTFHRKIKNEFDGKNDYSRKEDISSRRFVYTDDSCISFIQCAIRSRVMDFHVVIRSSNVEDTFCHDLKFLYYLASTCHDQYFRDHCDEVRLRFNLNSAHILL